MRKVSWFLAVGAQIWLVVICCRYAGHLVGLVYYLTAIMAATITAGILLKTAPAERISWKNQVASVCLPWAFLHGRGYLGGLLFWNFAISSLFGSAIAICSFMIDATRPLEADGALGGKVANVWHLVMGWTTASFWIITLAVWSRLLYLQLNSRLNSNQGAFLDRETLYILISAPASTLISAIMLYNGWVFCGFLVSMLPIFVVLAPSLLMMTVYIIAKIQGKPMRWN